MVPRSSSHETPTKTRIVEAAVVLFGERGYAGVGVDELGEAAGVQGPAIYQYFASKRDVLAAVLEPGVRHTRKIVEEIVARGDAPRTTLRNLVDAYVGVAVDAADRFQLYLREEHNLAPAARRRLARETAMFIDAWVTVLRSVRPELGADEARTVVHGVIGLVTGAVSARTIDDPDALRELVTKMTRGALGV